MDLRVERYSPKEQDTVGRFFINDQQECFSIEDAIRAQKIKGETAIPNGMYEVRFRKVMSPLTERYRKKYPWFTWHLEVCDVPNYSCIYIHAGNTKEDTDGCLVVGERPGVLAGKRAVLESVKAFERVYKKISAALEAGDRVTILYHVNPTVG